MPPFFKPIHVDVIRWIEILKCIAGRALYSIPRRVTVGIPVARGVVEAYGKTRLPLVLIHRIAQPVTSGPGIDVDVLGICPNVPNCLTRRHCSKLVFEFIDEIESAFSHLQSVTDVVTSLIRRFRNPDTHIRCGRRRKSRRSAGRAGRIVGVEDVVWFEHEARDRLNLIVEDHHGARSTMPGKA